LAATERFHDHKGELSKEERTRGELGDQAGKGNSGEKDDRVGAVADGNEAGKETPSRRGGKARKATGERC
jgi:hypothetical protein